MELTFTPIRTGILLILLITFWLLGGFSMPEIADYGYSRRLAKAWWTCMAIFVTGAVGASIVDHWVGNVERSNIRLIYILAGIVLMVIALVWQNGLKSNVESMNTNVEESY